MNIEETKEAIKIMQAYADGKTIEIERTIDEWVEVFCPQFDWVHCKYRIKPESEYRPFESAEEVMEAIKEHGDWVIDGNTYRRIDKVTDLGGGVAITLSGCKEWGVNELPRIEHLSFMDGTPFGMLEE